MNEASTSPLCALLMQRSVLILALVGFSSALRCHLYHDIVEAGKRMVIIPDKCTSDKYCVRATYKVLFILISSSQTCERLQPTQYNKTW